MLTALSLTNFKSISTSIPISLKEYSIFCGANSSGKSSLIQAMLMISQTFASRYDFDEVVLNGHLLRSGAFGDIRSHRTSASSICFEFTITTAKLRRGYTSTVNYKCTFGTKPDAGLPPSEDFHPVVQTAQISITHEHDNTVVAEHMKVTRVIGGMPDPLLGNLDSESKFRIDQLNSLELEKLSQEYPDYSLIGLESNSLAPYALHLEYNHTKKAAPYYISIATGEAILDEKNMVQRNAVLQKLIPHEFFVELKQSIDRERENIKTALKGRNWSDVLSKLGKSELDMDNFFSELLGFKVNPLILHRFFSNSSPVTIGTWLEFVSGLSATDRQGLKDLMGKRRAALQAAWENGAQPELRKTTVPLQGFQLLSNYLTSYFSRSVKYLGPLRAEPQAVYASLGHSDPRSVGLKGEFTAAVLHINRSRLVTYPSPVEVPSGELRFIKKRDQLQVACREWLHYLGVIYDYQTRDKGKLGYEISVKVDANDRWQDLTHVGVGVSQVLPIVLMYLLSEPGDLLIFEQPELHLHPAEPHA